MNSSSPLVLNGGTLDYNVTGNATQAFAGTTYGAGAASINVAAGDTLDLGSLTRNGGATINFGGQGTVRDDTFVSGANNVLVDANGTAYATFNGVDWATCNSGIIGALSMTGAYQSGAANYLPGNDMDVGASIPGQLDQPSSDFTVNTLRFNAFGLALDVTGANTIGTGGILVTGAGSADIIEGESIRAGAGRELVVINNGSLAIAASIADSASGSSALTLSGAGTLNLGAQSTYTGVTSLDGGVVTLASPENPGTSGPLGASLASNPGSIVFNGGTIQYSTANQFDYSGRFGAAAGQRISIDTNGQTVIFATALTSSNGSLTVKDGNATPGALILASVETYTGPTTVTGGALILSGSINGTCGTTVTNATLAGSGYIANSVTIGNEMCAPGSAVIEPGGRGAIGVLTIGDALTLDSDAAFAFNLNSTGGGGSSSELIADSISIDAASMFTFSDIAAAPAQLTPGTEFTSIDASGGITGSFLNLPNDSVFTYGPNTYEATYSSTELTLTVVPEPAAWGMTILGLGMLYSARKLRKRRIGS
jgi:fibronectin-binding autotransporter adhesin